MMLHLHKLSLMFLLIWYLADKYLKDRFNPYLKYSAILFIGILIAVDLFMFVSAERMINIQHEIEVNNTLMTTCLSYTYNITDSNATTTLFCPTDKESLATMSYLKSEYEIMQYFTMLLPYLAIFIALMMVIQYLYLSYVDKVM